MLKPGGRLAVVYNTRDDTVPWVRRLAALLQEVDPQAMRGDFGVDSMNRWPTAPTSARLERQNFRNWVPITRPAADHMVERRPGGRAARARRRDQLLADVGRLYDTSARPPDPLLLPFQTSCWRAEVDHSEDGDRRRPGRPADRALAQPKRDDASRSPAVTTGRNDS